ncbi:MAG: phosphatidate cytidylyltransferase [Candidatus Saccharibacteria bacterium]|nr:phosphatidate cytidylyltransferase [Pseudorhodobacter sp.]
MTSPARWADLKVRVASAVVLVALGFVEIWLGGTWFRAAVVVIFAAMIWELAGLTSSPDSAGVRLGLAAAAGLCLWFFAQWDWLGWLLVLVPVIGLAVTPRRDVTFIASYGLALMLAGAGFIELRAAGAGIFLWLVAVVVASDTMGYFAGRLIGGPKFWPRISPKKTWSGTIAGWLGAGVVGVIFAAFGWVPWVFALLSPVIAVAGQVGDIVESWIKRRAGAKDSSNLIPGHGGVMDRFDALVGAVLALEVLAFVMAGPI